MSKKAIWAIAVIMRLSFLGLLFIQFNYIEDMVNMKKEQFAESVNRALYQASRNMELNETLRYLENDINKKERKDCNENKSVKVSTSKAHQAPPSDIQGEPFSSFESKLSQAKPTLTPKALILRNDSNSISATKRDMQGIVRNRYVYKKAMLDEVVYNILYSASDKPLKQRVNFKLLDQDLKAELMNNGIDIPYHFSVSTQDGREVYRCPDYVSDGEQNSY